MASYETVRFGVKTYIAPQANPYVLAFSGAVAAQLLESFIWTPFNVVRAHRDQVLKDMKTSVAAEATGNASHFATELTWNRHETSFFLPSIFSQYLEHQRVSRIVQRILDHLYYNCSIPCFLLLLLRNCQHCHDQRITKSTAETKFTPDSGNIAMVP